MSNLSVPVARSSSAGGRGSGAPGRADLFLKLSILLAVPQTIVALIQVAGGHVPPFLAELLGGRVAWGCASAGVIGTGVWLFRRAVRSGAIWRPLAPVARYRLKSERHPEIDESVAHYRLLMTQHLRMLGMTTSELAERTGLKRFEIDYLVRRPDFFPRPDVVSSIRRALMVPETWPSNGYGDVNRGLPARRFEWVVFHELGHLVLHHRASSEYALEPARLTITERDRFVRQEDEANAFAELCHHVMNGLFDFLWKPRPSPVNR